MTLIERLRAYGDGAVDKLTRMDALEVANLLSARPEAVAIVQKHRRHVELSPGVGEAVQSYALAVCDDILSDLPKPQPSIPSK